jgi:hypothetical protein
VKERDRRSPPPKAVLVSSSETPKMGGEEGQKKINIAIPDGTEVFTPVNRFRVELIDGAVIIYVTYQNLYDPKVLRVTSLTVPFYTFKKFFVNETKDSFGKTVDKLRVANHQAVKVLTAEELSQAEIYDSIVNLGGLGVSAEGGGEAWFGMYSPWSGQAAAQAASARQPVPPVTARNILKCLMQVHVFAQFWDELVRVHGQIEVL